ncbi:hypothetical protein [Mucilaginibacter sp. KACC 22063]|uniref:hypothetical protein n=1 Tax=Mucilaginibacter sp. KACC 22063 TaxID=3025666 RepID=UPI002366639E|nr:hypothetical protein [Mucilaginibacter sp. KACC 22063]WDF53603.1 hypothetical protein PQ461_11670 [Mucilaginibacter sp. KACC 22063]
MKKYLLPLLLIAICSFTARKPSLKGSWIFAGGIYNGKRDSGTVGYNLKRIYDDKQFNAYVIQEGEKPERYQSGDYQLFSDSCFETETYNSQSADLTGKTLRYHYTIRHDSLIFNGVLPNGTTVEEYWQKAK